MYVREYINGLHGVLARIADGQGENIRRAGKIVADSLTDGGIIHTFGTGHSHIIAEDAFFRAGGIAAINPILDERFIFLKGALESTRAERKSGIAAELIKQESIGPNDAAIIISNSGRNAASIEMAVEMQNRGVPVVAITSVEQSSSSRSRHPSGKRLFEIADVVVDNCVPSGDALLKIDGIESMTGASSTVAGSAIIHSIVIDALSELADRGVSPSVLPSANVGDAVADALRNILGPFASRIRYLDVDTEID
jgi:uncharacterized phosphosugar-binding protein